MQVQDAVKKAQQRMGLTSEQPPLPAQSLLQLWQQAVADSADSPAFTCLGKTLTYGDVDKLADRAASYFYHEMNLRAGDRLAVQLPNLLQYPVVVVAAWKVGLVIVNTNPMYTHRELVHQFNDSGATVVVVLDQFYETRHKRNIVDAIPYSWTTTVSGIPSLKTWLSLRSVDSIWINDIKSI
jgi:long-chain acyl-CoA synthetase